MDSNHYWALWLGFFSSFVQLLLLFPQVLFNNSKASNSEWLFLWYDKWSKEKKLSCWWTFLEQLCSKRSPNLVYSITYVLVHMQRKRKQSFEGFAFFVCVNVGQKTVYAAPKSNVSSDIEELSGWPCLLFLVNCLLFVSLDQFGT